ncbi:MAG TPA: DUF4440 domain-containing protein [Caulobacteraceae bacterium]
MTKIQLAGVATAALMAASLGACTPPSPAADTGKIADAVKADVAQLVVAVNAHDADKFVSHDAPDVVAMFHGAPNSVGPAADAAAFKQGVAGDPSFKVSLASESVDVPASGDMAVYHSIYTQTATDPKTKQAATTKVNYLAGYKKQADGTWKIEWSVISDLPPDKAAAANGT